MVGGFPPIAGVEDRDQRGAAAQGDQDDIPVVARGVDLLEVSGAVQDVELDLEADVLSIALMASATSFSLPKYCAAYPSRTWASYLLRDRSRLP